MAGTQLFFDILARDHASATFNKVGAAAAALGKRTDQASKSHQAFGKIVRWTGGMLSAYGIATYLKSSMQEYAKAEAAQNRLGNSYQRFPKMQNATLQSFKELNKQLMLHTQFDDDDAAAMQANLGRFSLTGKQIQRLTPLVADLAQVQGTDLVTAGSAMGKAFLGNTRALKALGISYTATGNKAKDYRNIVDLINRKVGGESTKANQTAAVKLKMLENQWGELKETVGQAVLPAFNKLAQVAGPAITSLGRAVERNMPQIEQTFNDVWKAASKFGGALKGIWDGFSSMPDGVRNVLLALAGGTWAFGKIKGSALGTGISSMFSGLKTITAGNVTVVGKTVTGTPGGPGGKTSLLTAVGGPVGIAAIVTAAAAAYNAKRYTQDQRSPMPMPGPGGLPGLGNASAPIISGRNRASDAAARVTRQELEATARAAQDAAGAAGRLVTQIRIMPKPAKEAAAEANRVAAAVAKAAQGKQIKLTVKGAKEAAADAADVANKIRRIQNKDAKVTARSARQAANDAVNVANKLRAIPDAKPDVNVNLGNSLGAIAQVRTDLQNLDGNTATTYVKTVKIGVGGKATGGYISGPGSGTSDSIPAWLSNGEYVIRAAAVRRYGVGTFHRLNAMGFAEGGYAQAKKDANWQQRLAKFISKYQLGADAADWLAGLERKPARRFMKHPKQIGKFARRAGSVGAYRSAADAQRAYDAMLGDMGFDAMDAYARKSTLDQRIQAAAKDAGSKNPAKRAKAYEKLQTLRQKLADTEQEIADKQAAAAEKERSAQEAVRAAIEETAQSYRSFASIATTSVDDVTAAQEKLTTAQDAVTEARRKFDLAGNDRDRADAARQLAEAEKNLTAAQTARNAVSDKVTAGSIRANMGNKLTRLRDFASAVKTLKSQGLNATTLADILQMGPDQGYEYAKALLDGGLGDINAIQDEITRESADLGLFSAGVNSANATLIGQINAATGGLDVSLVPAPVTLNLNGQAIATALLEYQRQNGG